VPLPSRRGTGRVGEVTSELDLQAFATHVAAVLPATVWGVRAAGDSHRRVRTVAVCGGSGAALIADAYAAGADAYVTADLKHHPTSEAVPEVGADGMALIDAAHWATEAPWLHVVAARMREHFGTTVDVRVSPRCTDPWTLHAPSVRQEASS
jgi:putative NIF3 family GTP cyclohydrolase 1 type 2